MEAARKRKLSDFGRSPTWPRECKWSTTGWRNSAGFMTGSAAIGRGPHHHMPVRNLRRLTCKSMAGSRPPTAKSLLCPALMLFEGPFKPRGPVANRRATGELHYHA